MHYIQGTVFDEELQCTLAEICKFCGVSAELIHDMVNEGIMTPSGSSPLEWHFTPIEIKQVQTTVRLQHDLQINLPGCALALDLLDELEERRQLSRRKSY
ncbi:MAG: MerR family transcriptional regulator [Desulfobulbus propionicus]|nr:MAG: MerR family transcriptional regulator [Desulfobulbus propionicus]PIE64006.1 MAG: MerR family transcriptional regulator [Desulfobacterales bacterium]